MVSNCVLGSRDEDDNDAGDAVFNDDVNRSEVVSVLV